MAACSDPPRRFPILIRTRWKFPFFATFVFGFVSFLYDNTRERLERRNRELQRSVEKGAEQLENAGAGVASAPGSPQSLLPRDIPQLAGFEVAGAWRPARAVSGDYYDVSSSMITSLESASPTLWGRGVCGAADGQRSGCRARLFRQGRKPCPSVHQSE